MVLNPRSQSALEYMMTYGWAILIIVIVAAVLYSFGIFSPSSSISATITGFSGAGVTAASCINSVNNQILALSITDNTGYLINITSINTTSTNGVSASQSIGSELSPGSSAVFYVNAGCNKSSSAYSGSATITYTEPGQPLPGPYLSNGKIANVPVLSNLNLVAGLDGTNADFFIAGNSFPNGSSPRTAILWIYEKSDSTRFYVVDYGGSSSDSEFGLSLNEFSAGQFGLETCGNGWLSSATINLDTWYFLAIVWFGNGSPSFFVNGVNDSGGGTWGTPIINTQSGNQYLGSGNNQCHTGFYFNGSVSDFQIYSKALSSSQIQKIYSGGIGGAPVPNTGLIAWLPLDGNANDYSGNNNNGVSYNVQWVSP
ncbi:LamG domain-containing protein [Candidatus Parvarchaeota archaeon]|nr:LamG domain-containing protein [Candidatus Parvarchaeota archaeon]